MNRKKLPRKEQVEAFIKRSVSNEVWDYAVEQQFVAESATYDDPIGWLSKEILRLQRLDPALASKSSDEFVPMRRQRRKRASGLRGEVISEVIAAIAREREEVRQFRAEALAGRVLEPGEVPAWIEARTNEGFGRHAVIVALPDDAHLDWRDQWVCEPPLSSIPNLRIEGYAPVDLLDYPKPGEKWIHRTPINRYGVLRWLKVTASNLARLFGWQEAQATVFILTNLTPSIPTNTITVSSAPHVRQHERGPQPVFCLARITLTVDPSTSPRELAELYRKSRAKLLSKRSRGLSLKHMFLAGFSSHYNRLTAQRMGAWNETFPEWKYKELSLFRRDAQIARRRLIGDSKLDLSKMFG